ncbi:acyl carrier protein [Nonomuraea africana]|uniref:Acyl carrier protein n=1 Tax=Nonomuraea africana TaxID=46171 RepID=A0ABR9KIK9_9ACTN|nr:acyl carrier protein [Nonomuraea africana]MBE1561857.1 acyl carrier protein [Nonomuraea africana]
MKDFDLDDLRKVMLISAGVDEGIDIEGDILDTSFTDMGFDSLAVLELVSRIERDWGVAVPDEVASDLKTPGEVLDYVNRRAGVN